MSVVRCDRCCRQVDSDFDLDCFTDDGVACEPCREKTEGDAMKLSLHVAWSIRAKLRAEGDKLRAEGAKLRAEGAKLRAEGAKLRAEGDKLWAEGDKLWAEGDKLWAEGAKLRAEGDKLWAEEILKVHGNITLEWKWRSDVSAYDCILGSGEHYKADEVDA